MDLCEHNIENISSYLILFNKTLTKINKKVTLNDYSYKTPNSNKFEKVYYKKEKSKYL